MSKVEKKQIEVIVWQTYYGNVSAHNSAMDMSKGENPWVQLSKPTVLEYEELSKGEILAKQVAAIDNEMSEIREQALKKIELLEGKKQELLALSHDIPADEMTSDLFEAGQ